MHEWHIIFGYREPYGDQVPVVPELLALPQFSGISSPFSMSCQQALPHILARGTDQSEEIFGDGTTIRVKIVWCISLLWGITNQFGGDTRISSLDGTKYHREKVRYQDSSAT